MSTRETIGISQARLSQVLGYDPETGLFIWMHRPERSPKWNGRYAGRVAGGVYKNGYRYICIDFIDYRANRLAWLIMTGEEPSGFIDHADGIKTNDAWSNLRLATPSENGANRPKQKNNTSGFKGVYWHSQNSCWTAQICCRGRRRHLGLFETAEAASEAYKRAADAAFGRFARAA